jgi:hypothetical protein
VNIQQYNNPNIWSEVFIKYKKYGNQGVKGKLSANLGKTGSRKSIWISESLTKLRNLAISRLYYL